MNPLAAVAPSATPFRSVGRRRRVGSRRFEFDLDVYQPHFYTILRRANRRLMEHGGRRHVVADGMWRAANTVTDELTFPAEGRADSAGHGVAVGQAIAKLTRKLSVVGRRLRRYRIVPSIHNCFIRERDTV